MARVILREIAVARLRQPLRRPFVTALRSTVSVTSLLVRLTDDDGVNGYGEAPEVWRVTGESVAGARACVLGPLADTFRAHGTELTTLGALHDALAASVVGNGGARAAVESAAADLLARRAGVGLAEQLGGAPTASVATDLTLAATGELPDADELRGFTRLKVKVGVAGDVERVLRIRDIAPGAPRFRIDANQGWTVAEAVRAIEAWRAEGLDLEFVEQPLRARDLTGHAELRRTIDVPIMLDESVFGLDDLDRAVEHGAADLVNIKLAKCGGPSAGLRLASRARRHGLGVLVGSMMESAVGVGAAAALAATVAPGLTHDLDAAWWVRPRVRSAPRYRDDAFLLGAGPGLTEVADAVVRGARWTARPLG